MKKGTFVRVKKLSDDKYNGFHPNGIDKGYTEQGIVQEDLEVGKRFHISRVGHYLVTSTVTEIIDENTFKTKNSTYNIISVVKTIREGVFETNSSSTHSITIMSKQNFQRWQNEELLYNPYEDHLADPADLDEDPDDYFTYNQYFDDVCLEIDVNEHTTDSGDEIVIICKHGRDC